MELILHPKKKISPFEIEKSCASLSLIRTMKASLKSLPENTHWHYKKDKEKGVLEITLLPQKNEVIITCKANRYADWINEAMKELDAALR
jgi:hypothetical protein